MSEQRSKVLVCSKLTAVSSHPVEPGKTHLLTPLDQAMGQHSLHLVFYYEKNPFRSFDWDPLRVSLSETLSLYSPVTGRLTRGEAGNWEVKCNDAGVRVVRAKVSVRIDEWLKYANGIEEKDLAFWEEMPENPNTWSPFRIQVSEFEGGGIAIGINCSHMNADLTSLILFFKTWTEVHQQQAIANPPVFSSALHGRPLPKANTKSAKYYVTKSIAEAPSVKMASTTFKFSNSVIKQCLSEIRVNCPDATPFDLLAAIFWMSVARLKGSKDEHTHSLSICIDFRRLLKEPLPCGYFGNALHFSLLSLREKDMIPGELGHVVDAVHGHLVGIKEEEILSAVGWLESQKGEGGKFAPPFRMYGPELTCVNTEHMVDGDQSLMYTAMFEENVKPAHVAYHVGNVAGEGLIMVMPTPEEGLARTVMVTLPEDEMVKLCEDESILRLEPTRLLSGGL
ncbi:protein ECERIFERUM 2-like [Durio zibethinus]|uniref:Protein ECERIFERUM 2-like n=1 Tax=Durio zibethinus TaxID=66656 RepID=A0A6P5YX06_DURZI|nr:protein ECERIFERUM 2-like [Durio zibethinus]